MYYHYCDHQEFLKVVAWSMIGSKVGLTGGCLGFAHGWLCQWVMHRGHVGQLERGGRQGGLQARGFRTLTGAGGQTDAGLQCRRHTVGMALALVLAWQQMPCSLPVAAGWGALRAGALGAECIHFLAGTIKEITVGMALYTGFVFIAQNTAI